MTETIRRRLRPHWPFAIVLAVAATLVLVRLGQDYLWSDEGDTAVLASNVLEHGVPTAWDGVAFIDSDFGKRVNDDLIMVSHPWLQYYVAAGSFAVFGRTAFAARVPFAVLGLLTIVLVYVLTWEVTRRRWTALAAAILLLCSVQFLLYARQSRYYTLTAALTCLLVWQFRRLRGWPSTLGFAIIAILLFHSHPIAIAPLLALGVITLLPGPFRESRRWVWRAIPIVAVFTLPWLLWASRGYGENADVIARLGQFLPRLGQFAVECGSVTPLPAVIALLLYLVWRSRSRPRNPRDTTAIFGTEERSLAAMIGAILVSYAVVIATTQSRDTIWSVGLRYTPAVIPFVAMLAALTIATVARHRRGLAIGLTLVLALTKFGRLTPWTFWHATVAKRDPAAVVSFHNPERPVDRVLRTGQIAFLRSLRQPTVGTTGRIVEFLNDHATPGDVVLTNFDWEPIYFHTHLPLGMTVLSSYPIYQAAKAHGLPDYVFRATDARWIVWRRAWGAYRGQSIDQVLSRLSEAQFTVTQVATLEETLWENRENLHFRRFTNGYIFPWYQEVPETVIYRVDGRPGSSSGGGAASTP